MSRIGERRRFYHDDDGGRSRKRRRTDNVDIEDRLESLITRVGEKSNSSLESNLEGLANVLEADLSNYKERILKIICTCATNLPEKVTVYSTLVGLLNGKNYNCGEEFLDMMMDNLRDVLMAYQFERARLMVRFIADLVNCRVVLPSSLLELFEKFLAATMENDVPQVRSDWFIYTILSALPWVGKELSEKRGSDFERILSTIEDYISQRKKTHVAALRVWSTDNPHPQEEYLDCLWAQMKNLKSNNWQEKHIRRPYLAFDSVLADALQHVLPTVSLPPHKEEVTYPLPTVVYRMFDYTDVPEGPAMPGAHSIERFLVEEAIRRVINAHSKDRKECANQLVNMYGRSKVPHNYCIVEVLFSEMLRLPETQHIHVYYGSLFIELCKLQQSAMPGVLAQATELIFDRLDTMNTTCIDRFVDWFSYHLSNFHFKWSWDDWLSASENPDLPRYRFLCELFEKLKRLMYQQFVTQLLPEGLQPLVPPAPEPLYRFTPDKTELPGVDIAKQLLEAIKAKKDQDELQTILNEISHNATGQPDSNDATELSFPALRIEVLLQTLLKLGSKSISHTFNALTKFQKLIMDLVTNEEAQVHVLRTVKEFWQDHPQMLVVLVNKLLKMQIVESASVVNWLLGKDMTDDFMRKYTWEIMAETLKKMNNHTSQVEKEVQDAKRGLELLEEKAKKEVENGDQEDEKVKQLKAKLQEETEKKQQLIEELTEKLENAQRDQKQVFLVVFQRFILILTEHLVRCEQHQMDVNTQWFIYATDRLREILLTNHRQVFQYQATLETLLFTSDLDPHILNIFNQFKALRA